TRGVALLLTVTVAQLVTKLQGPATSTQYMPASASETEPRFSELLIWFAMSWWFLRHTYVNGPGPEVSVWNVALSPTQRIISTNAVLIVTLVCTVSRAQLVTEFNAPVTFTQ